MRVRNRRGTSYEDFRARGYLRRDPNELDSELFSNWTNYQYLTNEQDQVVSVAAGPLPNGQMQIFGSTGTVGPQPNTDRVDWIASGNMGAGSTVRSATTNGAASPNSS